MRPPSGSLVCVFGLPCSGKTTLINVVKAASKEIIGYISSGDIARELSTQQEIKHMAAGNLYPFEEPLRNKILELVEKRRASGAEVIFLDGFPRFDDQVLWLVQNQLVGQAGGCIVQVRGDKLLERARIRYRDDQDAAQAVVSKIRKQEEMIPGLEKVIFKYGIPYYTVVNQDLEPAAKILTQYIGLRK